VKSDDDELRRLEGIHLRNDECYQIKYHGNSKEREESNPLRRLHLNPFFSGKEKESRKREREKESDWIIV